MSQTLAAGFGTMAAVDQHQPNVRNVAPMSALSVGLVDCCTATTGEFW